MGTYFTAASWAVTSGNIVYATDLNNPLSALDTGLTSLIDDIRTGDGLKYAADTGSANAYAVSLTPAVTSYEDGLEVWLKPANTNTGASTIAVNGLTAVSIRRFGLQALEAGDLQANYYAHLKYSNGVFQIVSVAGAANAAAATSAAEALASETAAAASETAAAASEDAAAASETAAAASAASAAMAYVMVSETQADGTQGGTFTSGSWQTRTINSEDSDTDGICSISSNQITLAAGTYRCSISAPAYAVDTHQIRLRNITDAATTLVGTSEFSYSDATGYATNRSWIKGQFTIAAQKTFEVQHIGETTSADSGLGGAGNADYGEVEIYTIAEFWAVE